MPEQWGYFNNRVYLQAMKKFSLHEMHVLRLLGPQSYPPLSGCSESLGEYFEI